MNVYIPSTGFATQGPCAEGFHVPMKSEWEGLISIMDSLSLTTGNDYKIKLHIPFSGLLSWANGTAFSQGTQFRCWCCDTSSSDANYILLDSSGRITDSTTKMNGHSIRPFKDGFVTPDNTWTVITGTLGSGGIFWNSADGLISITSDGSTGYTISDKNCGATTVYSDGDTLSESNCGKYYQRGNNYGFAYTGATTTSTTQVDASSYGPGNFYNSSTFIYNSSTPGDWSSVQNNNLRGGVDGNVNITTMKELKNAYIGEAPYEGDELCFTANTAGSTISLNKTGSPTAVTLETSTDGSNWSTYTIGNTITLSNVGDKVYFRNTSTTDTGFSTSGSNYYQFVMTGSIAGSGDVNYLLNKNSTTTVSDYCYYRLFYQCASLTTAPQLPATTLALLCYVHMFNSCTGLATAPSLPATTLANYCYSSMFYHCTSLTTAPELPATTLANNCYYSMFHSCTSLTISPQLPATTLASNCYSQMFHSCTALTTFPQLPATTLATECYKFMFTYCSKIKLSTTQTGEYQTAYRIPTSGTGTTATDAFTDMFYSTGGTRAGTPSINTTYYTSNTIV